MKRFAAVALLAVLSLLACGRADAQASGPNLHFQNGVFNAPAYQTWRATVFNGPYSSGSTSITVAPAYVTLADGYQFTPFTTNVSLTVGVGTPNSEVVTPSAVSIGACPAGVPNNFQGLCATVTATFSNTHGQGDIVATGSNGIQDAIQDAANQDGGLVYWQVDTGYVTLNTSGLTTTTTTKVPPQFISQGAAARVGTTITVTASWAVGISGSTSAFCTANSTLTSGTTCIANMNSPATVGTTSPYSLTAILFTGATSNPGAGTIKAKVWGYTAVQPGS